jgi:hypothetical protein
VSSLAQRLNDPLNRLFINIYTLHTYHSRFIPEGVREASQISDIPPKRPRFTKIILAMSNTADVTHGKPIAV